MNIFVVDSDPIKAAQALCDKHIVKMVLETAQILSTVSWLRNVPAPYGITHKNHPAIIWTNQTLANWQWLCNHGIGLCQEYTLRYCKQHKSQEIIQWCIDVGGHPPNGDLTPFAQCMPDKYKSQDAVASYRNYYLGEKKNFATWRALSNPPNWWI